jgi:hypothetical protein
MPTIIAGIQHITIQVMSIIMAAIRRILEQNPSTERNTSTQNGVGCR